MKTRVEEPKPFDASLAAITLVTICPRAGGNAVEGAGVVRPRVRRDSTLAGREHVVALLDADPDDGSKTPGQIHVILNFFDEIVRKTGKK